MAEQRWEVTIVDENSEDVEKDEIRQYEARVTANSEEEARDRAVTMIRDLVKGVTGHKLVPTHVARIWKPGQRRS